MRIFGNSFWKTMIGLFVVVTSTTSGNAQETWSGFYIGGGGGFGSASTDAQLVNSTTSSSFDTCRVVGNQPNPRNLSQCPVPGGPGSFTPNPFVIGDVSPPFNQLAAAPINIAQSIGERDTTWIGTAFVGFDQQIGQSLIGGFADIS